MYGIWTRYIPLTSSEEEGRGRTVKQKHLPLQHNNKEGDGDEKRRREERGEGDEGRIDRSSLRRYCATAQAWEGTLGISSVLATVRLGEIPY